jgi:NarL family two-component system response regulator LiaR
VDKIKVLLADDHILFGEGMRRLLMTEADIECVAIAADGEEAVRLTKELHPDVVLIDIAMPKMDGIEAARQIKSACPQTAVVIISAYKYDHYVLACMQAGVNGYLLKNTPHSDMVNAIRMVRSGEGVFSLEATGKVLRRLASDKGNLETGFGGLHKRELQVLKLAAAGLGNKEIARELGISENTVATHFVNIFRKLGVESRTEAALYAFREGWLKVEDIASR